MVNALIQFLSTQVGLYVAVACSIVVSALISTWAHYGEPLSRSDEIESYFQLISASAFGYLNCVSILGSWNEKQPFAQQSLTLAFLYVFVGFALTGWSIGTLWSKGLYQFNARRKANKS